MRGGMTMTREGTGASVAVLVSLLLLFVVVVPFHIVGLERCGTQSPDENALLRIREERAAIRASKASLTATQDDKWIKVFPVTFHVFEDSSKQFVNVPDEAIFHQLDVINQAFAGNTSAVSVDTRIRVILKRIARYNDDEMATRCLLRMGNSWGLALEDPTSIHIFVCNLRELSKKLGQAQFPCTEYIDNERFDGAAWIDSQSLASIDGLYNAASPYDLGHTAVHELGHVFGLFHTFHTESCFGSGDLVEDTPQQSRANHGDCGSIWDSCPLLPGADPIENFMDYSHDKCMDRFTAGQVERMHDEIDRCLTQRMLPLVTEKICTTNGRTGSATSGDKCRASCTAARVFPNRRKNTRKIRWCRTTTGKWGSCTCRTVQILPTPPPSASPTRSPTSSPSKSPTWSPSQSPSSSPSASPTIYTPVCSSLSPEECKRFPENCRYLGLSAPVRRGLPARCLRAVGCRPIGSYCSGLCQRVCSDKSKFCSWNTRTRRCLQK